MKLISILVMLFSIGAFANCNSMQAATASVRQAKGEHQVTDTVLMGGGYWCKAKNFRSSVSGNAKNGFTVTVTYTHDCDYWAEEVGLGKSHLLNTKPKSCKATYEVTEGYWACSVSKKTKKCTKN